MISAEYKTMRDTEDTYWWYRGLRRMVTDTVHSLLPHPAARVLDAGCGTGGQMHDIHQRLLLSHLYGIDISGAGLAYTRQRGLHRLGAATTARLPFAANTFDLVYSLDVLQMSGLDLPAMVELSRVLKPGGALLINLPAFPALAGQHDLAVKIDRRYFKNEVTNGLRRAGLSPLKVYYWNTALFIPALIMRRLRKHNSHATPTSDLFHLPPLINAALSVWIAAENEAAKRLPLPVGTSVFAIARKPAP